MVHGIRLRDGRAEWYRNRWVRAEHVARALGEERRPGPQPHGDMDVGPNTNVIGHAGRTFALVEAGRPAVRADRPTSNPSAPPTSAARSSGGYTAHPKRDPESGELYAVSYFWGWGNDVEVTVIDTEAKVRSARRVSLGGSTSLHDCAITERFVVLLDLPVIFSMEAVQQGALFPYRWQEGYHSRVGLLPRDGQSTDVVWHDVEPCYAFHFMNAYDDGEGVVLDVVRYDSVFRTSLLGPDESEPTLDRWHLDGHGGPVKEERLDDRGQEFPRVDERRVGRPHRYGYAVSSAASPVDTTEAAHHPPRLRRGHVHGAPVGERRHAGRGGLRAPGRRRRRGRRLAARPRLLEGERLLGPAHPRHGGPDRRSPGGRGAPAAGPGRIPRQLGA